MYFVLVYKVSGPRSGRLKIAQRFIAGIKCELKYESAKRTAEQKLAIISRPLCGLPTKVIALPQH
jgi:hypothetical protein